jgi:NAD(P)-dependent dehydrogenase (short-subunit alcohol dehydrogenase family)
MEASIMMIGQKIVVVGSTAGIGLAVARNAADCGAEVYIGSSNAQKLESTLGALQGVRGAVVDVGNEESVAHFFSDISEIEPKVQHNGSITLTSGILSARAAAGLGVLASVNAGIEALSRTLALELAPRRVNTVCPGFIDSGKLWKDLPAEERQAKMREKAASDLLTVRVGLPDDAAKSYLYAIQNPYVTGQTIIADGGASLT